MSDLRTRMGISSIVDVNRLVGLAISNAWLKKMAQKNVKFRNKL